MGYFKLMLVVCSYILWIALVVTFGFFFFYIFDYALVKRYFIKCVQKVIKAINFHLEWFARL